VLVDRGQIEDALRAAGHTVGRTRRAVVDAVLAFDVAFTAEELDRRLPEVHAATIYRTLGVLEEVGAVRHVHLAHGPALYEPAGLAVSTRHVVCEVCGAHISVPASVFDEASRRLRLEHGFVLDGTHFAFVGRCADCAGSEHGGHR
jgi:Fur family ferric uptake transcriptional regulator